MEDRYFFRCCALFIACLASAKLSASCCSGASSAGIGPLRLHERASLTLSNDAHRVLGFIDKNARFHSGQASHLPKWRFNFELLAMLRALDWLQPFIKLPARTQVSSVRVGAQAADMSLGAHMPLFNEGFFSLPALSLTSALKLPTGVAAGDNAELREENITSMGSYEFSLSIMLQKSVGACNVAMGYGIAFDPSLFTREFNPGLGHSLTTAISFIPHSNAHMQFGLSPTFYSDARIAGKALRHSSRRQLTTSLAYSLMIHSHVTISALVGSTLPLSGVGRNSESDIFAQLGMRVGVF